MSPWRPSPRVCVAAGSLLIVVGLALGLTGVVTLAIGPPSGWVGAARELATPPAEAPATDLTSPSGSDAGDRAADVASAASATSGPVLAIPTPLVMLAEPTTQPTAPGSTPYESASVPEAVTAPTVAASDPSPQEPPFLPITRILIPRIRLDTEVAPAKLVEREGGVTWEIPPFLAGHAEATAGAGGFGNAVLLGHLNSREAGNVFQHLDRVGVGDQIQVFSEAGSFDYRVVNVRTVPRTDVSILHPIRMATLSLITCSGTWLPFLRDYTQRLVVHAELTAPVSAPLTQPARGLPVAEPASPATTAPIALSTPVATATIAQSAPVGAAKLTTVFEEWFTDNRRQWPNDLLGTAWFADGAYYLSAREPGRFVAVGAPIGRPLRDVVVSGAFRKVGGPPGGGYGLIVRDQATASRDGINQSGRYYVLEVGDRGELGIWRREEDHWEDLLRWSPSDTVRPGTETNELTVRAIGSRLTFVVNGVQVAGLEDSTLMEGGVGIFVGGDLNEARVERLVVQSVQSP
jgi:LPXTG-site transpeptidase (sortase) family protein